MSNGNRMNRQRRQMLISAALMGVAPIGRSADKSVDNAVYRALFAYFESKSTEPSHIFISEKAAGLEEVLPEHRPDISRSERLEALVPGTTESLRDRFLKVLQLTRAIDVDSGVAQGRFKLTLVPKNRPEGSFTTWADFSARFPEAKALLQLSHVAVDEDMQTALVYAGAWCGNLCGAGYLFLLANLNDGWRVVHEHRLWVA